MSLKNKLTRLAKTEKGKELIDKAQAIAKDPKNREKLATVRGKVEEGLDTAKHKIAEKRGEKDGAGATSGTATATDPATTPTPPAPATSPPTEADYGGDEGPKAA